MKRYTRFEESGYSSSAKDVEDLTSRFISFADKFKIKYNSLDDRKLKREIEEFLFDSGEDADYTNEIFSRIKNNKNFEEIIFNILDNAVSRRLQSTSKDYKTNKELLDDTLDYGLLDNNEIRRKTFFKDFDFMNKKYYKILLDLMPQLKRIY